MRYLVFLLLMFFAWDSFSQNFYFGNDLSYANQMEDGGAVYKENMQAKDVYHIFADHGTILVRVRLWVDPSWWQSPLLQPVGVKPVYNDILDVKETIRRDFPPPGSDLPANLGDLAVLQRDIAGVTGLAGTIDNRTASDHRIMHRLAPWDSMLAA